LFDRQADNVWLRRPPIDESQCGEYTFDQLSRFFVIGHTVCFSWSNRQRLTHNARAFTYRRRTMMKRFLVILTVLAGFTLAGSSAEAGWRRREYRRAYYGGPAYGAYNRGGYYGTPYYNNYYRGSYYPNAYNNGYYTNGAYVAPGVGTTVVTPGGAVGVGVY
jgi:hypothetical protein